MLEELEKRGLISAVTSFSIRISDYQMIITTPYPRLAPLQLSYLKRELRWEEGPWDTYLHSKIYRKIERAKSVLFLFNPEILKVGEEEGWRDVWGRRLAPEISVVEVEEEPVQERLLLPLLTNLLLKNVVIFPRFGLYLIGRSWEELLRKVVQLHDSARFSLLFTQSQ